MITIKFEQNRSAAYDEEKFVGECCFEIEQNVWILNHTFVDSNYGGQGIAKKLLDCVVENVRKNKAKIKAVCSYVAHEFEKNAESYSDVKV